MLFLVDCVQGRLLISGAGGYSRQVCAVSRFDMLQSWALMGACCLVSKRLRLPASSFVHCFA